MLKIILALALALVMTGCGDSAPKADGNSPDIPEASGSTDADTASLAYLASRVGQYPHDIDLWNTQPLNTRLHALLGEQYPTFIDNMEVQGPLETFDGAVWTSGNRAHQGGIEAAVLLVDTRTDALEVYLLTGHRLWHHAEREPRIALQGDAATMVGNLRTAAEQPR